tara:strand:- start:2497 stop:2820 length:324 start_codon:yes stop_codon:yes gene_type:complete
MALEWLIIAVVILVVFMIIFKSQDLMFVFMLIKKYMFFFIILVLILFFGFSLAKVYSQHDVDLTSFSGFSQAVKVYFVWMKGLFVNMGQITGYVVQNWAGNSTASGG